MRTAAYLLLILLVVGCGLLGGSKDPDKEFGHRRPERTPEDPDIISVAPPDTTRSFFYTEAPVMEVIPRAGPAENGLVPMEIFVRGAFPDACYELHAVEQRRSAQLVDVTLTARRPQGAFCATVVRPYRFSVNGKQVPFEVRARG
jgi:hypothetical protein